MPSATQLLIAIEAVDNASEVLVATDEQFKATAASAQEAATAIEESGVRIDDSLGKTGIAAKASADEQKIQDDEIMAKQKEMQAEQDLSGKKIGGIFKSLGGQASSFGLPFSESMTKVGEGLGEAEIKTKSFSSTMSSMGGTILKVGAIGLAAVAAESLRLGMTFQASTDKMAGAAGISINAANKMGNAFLSTGGKTIFSGEQIMTAYAGVAGQLKATQGRALSTGQAMDVMNSATNLADATGGSLKTTTTALAAIMQVYHMKANQAAGASNELYAASNALGEPITALQTQIQRMVSQLGAAAPNLHQTSILMLDLAQHGETGRMASRGLSTAMSSLMGSSLQTQGAIATLGLHVYNSAGKFVGMGSVIAQLQPKLQGMDAVQRHLIETQLFGARGALALDKTIMAGSQGYETATKAINRSNTAQAGAAKMSKSLKDQIEIMKSAVEDLGIKFGMFLIPKLTELAHVIMASIGWLEKHKAVAIALGVVIGGFLAVAIGVKIVMALKSFATGVMEAAKVVGAAMDAVGWWGIAIAAAGVIILLIVTHMKLFKEIVRDVTKFAVEQFHNFLAGVQIVWNWIKSNWPMLLAILGGPIGIAIMLVIKHFNEIKTTVQDVVNFVVSTLEKIIDFFTSMPSKIVSALDKLADYFLNLGKKLVDSLLKSFKNIGGSIMHSIAGSIPGLSSVGSLVGLAKGGIVNKPTLAVVGEAGPEAVVPLSGVSASKSGIQSLSSGGASSSQAPMNYIHVDLRGATAMNDASMQQLADRVGKSLTKTLATRGAVIRA